jgi:hypothetical protein
MAWNSCNPRYFVLCENLVIELQSQKGKWLQEAFRLTILKARANLIAFKIASIFVHL